MLSWWGTIIKFPRLYTRRSRCHKTMRTSLSPQHALSLHAVRGEYVFEYACHGRPHCSSTKRRRVGWGSTNVWLYLVPRLSQLFCVQWPLCFVSKWLAPLLSFHGLWRKRTIHLWVVMLLQQAYLLELRLQARVPFLLVSEITPSGQRYLVTFILWINSFNYYYLRVSPVA